VHASNAAIEMIDLENTEISHILHSPASLTNCSFRETQFKGCDFSGAVITDAAIEGLVINGVAVSDLFEAYEKDKD
jgi:uncharacterized protein YjbI with pentapeptide repeats